MADDNRSLFDIFEDMKALEEDFLIEAEKFYFVIYLNYCF